MLDDVRTPFKNRFEAGRLLGERLAALHLKAPVVLALPRGGVPVGAEVARALDAPLDLLLVRKIGVPWQPELAVAAVMDGSEPVVVIEPRVRADAGVGQEYIDQRAKEELAEIERRRHSYLADRAPVSVAGRTAIVVDDGIATGTTMRAALKGLRREVDDVVCLAQPDFMGAIGYYYLDFHQLSDDEVVALMRQTPATESTVAQ